VERGLAQTKALMAITHWVHKQFRDGVECNLHKLTPPTIADLINMLNASKGKKDSDSKPFYPDLYRF